VFAPSRQNGWTDATSPQPPRLALQTDDDSSQIVQAYRAFSTLIEMRPMRFLLSACLLLPTLVVHAADPVPTFTKDQVAFYEKQVKPILAANCLKCHGEDPKKIRGGFNLLNRAAVLEGGETGPAVDLKKPLESLFIKAITYKHAEETYHMPPAGKMPDTQLTLLTKWVQDGLPWSADGLTQPNTPKHSEGVVNDKDYWAYQPLKRPAVPAVKNVNWVKTPVDAFILAKLEAKGLSPVGQASKTVLVRRAYYDLTGLPPTPEQVDRFVNDPSANAWEKLVDELLNSQHYGEKWGRHWLDVVRYAETNGYERDGPKPYAWRYRDYVIRSFNSDKPYDQFIKEQIAGDELPGAREKPDYIIATGFYRLGIWDDEPANPLQSIFDGYDDLVTVTGQGFLAMTLNCARCHDHKGDYIPQADYYKLLAFFRDITALLREPRCAFKLQPDRHHELRETQSLRSGVAGTPGQNRGTCQEGGNPGRCRDQENEC
jgi:mono/diheme cytochrome c family protein